MPELSLALIAVAEQVSYPLRASYTNWEPHEAFCELVQNWRDGIIASSKLSEDEFKVTRQEKKTGTKTEIVFQAGRTWYDRKKPQCIGYIRFLGTNGRGTVEITNQNATLLPKHLDIGGTTKPGVNQQAGAHGEGLKIALTVLMRGPQNHRVRCQSGGFNWYFNFDSFGKLVARLERMSPTDIKKTRHYAQLESIDKENLILIGANSATDVQFIIGEWDPSGRTERGEKTTRRRVPLEDFKAWTAAVLFL